MWVAHGVVGVVTNVFPGVRLEHTRLLCQKPFKLYSGSCDVRQHHGHACQELCIWDSSHIIDQYSSRN